MRILQLTAVALKSSTLGSLSLDRDKEEMMKWCDDGGVVRAAKTPLLPLKPQLMWWQKQVPGSSAKTQVCEPEVINVWELMDGLDDKDEDGEERSHGIAWTRQLHDGLVPLSRLRLLGVVLSWSVRRTYPYVGKEARS